MLRLIEYEKEYNSNYTSKMVYIFDDEKITEKNARNLLRAEKYSPFGFSLYREHYELLKKIYT